MEREHKTLMLCSSLLSSRNPSFHLFEGVFEKQTRVDAVRQEAGEKKEPDLIQSN